jgi:hypothetical protein
MTRLLREWWEFEYLWADALLSAMFPRSEQIPVGIEDMDVRGYWRSSLGRIPLVPAVGMRAAVWLLNFSPLYAQRKFGTFYGLNPDARMTLLAELAKSEIYLVRQLATALKAHVAMFYARDARVLEAIFGADNLGPSALPERRALPLLPRASAAATTPAATSAGATP